MTTATDQEHIYDVVGIGFGPSNLSVALALYESGKIPSNKLKFVERRSQFWWHDDMMLNGARMQVSFIKDLATMRDPTSRYTFLKYLHEMGHLATFTNLKTLNPLRSEFRDYMRWAANQVADLVTYNARVTSVEPILDEKDVVKLLQVKYIHQNTESRQLLARTVIFSTGSTPHFGFPVDVTTQAQVFHSHQFLTRIRTICVGRDPEFLVVGGGQSAVESALYLHSAYPTACITVCSRSHTLRPMDDSSFVNEVFLPERVGSWYELDEKTRRSLLSEYKHTNYACVNAELLRTLYDLLYEQRVCSSRQQRLRLILGTECVSAKPLASRIRCKLRNSHDMGRETSHDCDYVIVATGYRHNVDMDLIAPITKFLALTNDGELRVDRNYSVTTQGAFLPQIFALGTNETTHGPGDTLLSNMAVRAAEVAATIEARRDMYEFV
jgi:L-ornithine N5-monooxygenase